MFKIFPDNDDSDHHDDGVADGSSLLDAIVRDGARQMLAAALQAEVAADVDTAVGAVPVTAPRANDKTTGERKRFASAILPAWARKSPRSPRCCCCRTCTDSRPVTSRRSWSSFSAQPQGCRRQRSSA